MNTMMKPGRKMQPGRRAFDEHIKRWGFFLGYCKGCGEKVFLPPPEMSEVIETMIKDHRSVDMRILRALSSYRKI